MPRSPLPSGRRSFLLLLAVAVALIGGAWWCNRPPHDPEHNGERLSAVVMTLPDGEDELASYPERLRAFGSETLPWLLYMLEHGRHPPEGNRLLTIRTALYRMRGLFAQKYGAQDFDERPFAAFALGQLGPYAKPAVPLLIKSLGSENDHLLYLSAQALNAIGPASWPAVRKAVATQNVRIRAMLLLTMPSRLGTDANHAPDAEVAFLVNVLTDACRNPQTSQYAAAALDRCHRVRPSCWAFDSAIPVLVELLSDSELVTRQLAEIALAGFGRKAATAIPRLIELLGDESKSNRASAARALGFVDTAEKRSEAALRVMLYDTEPLCRDMAVDALRKMGLNPFQLNRKPE